MSFSEFVALALGAGSGESRRLDEKGGGKSMVLRASVRGPATAGPEKSGMAHPGIRSLSRSLGCRPDLGRGRRFLPRQMGIGPCENRG